MKKIKRKNQIIITSLAIMIAAAGYLNFAGAKLGDKNDLTNASGSNVETIGTDITDEDIYQENLNAGSDYLTQEGTETVSDIDSMDSDGEDTDVPGTAVLTNGMAATDIIAQAKITREQVRSKNRELLSEIIDNSNVASSEKQTAINAMIELTDRADKEAAVESLLAAKGFADVVVSITENSADVVVNETELTDAGRAQIEDIMKRKTGVDGSEIVITLAESKQ